MGLRAYAQALAASSLHLAEGLAKARQQGPGVASPAAPVRQAAVSEERGPNVGRPRSAFLDPLSQAMGMGWKERLWGNSFEMTRELVSQAPIIGVIISTRANEVLPFGKRSTNRFMPGFRVRLRDPREEPTQASSQRADQISDFLEACGDPSSSALRDSLPTYLYKCANDSLFYAQHGTETVRDRAGRPNSFYAVDGTTLRLAQWAEPNVSDDLEKQVRYVQVVHGRIVTEYTQRQLIFSIRNPTTDIRMAGYGVSEIEKVQRACAAILETWQYNVRAFTQGTNIRGIMNLREPLNRSQFEDFREDFHRWTRGVENAHTTNVMNAAAGFDYTDLSRSNRDLEYGEWTNFLIRILCAAYNVSTEQIGFSYGNMGQTTALAEQNNEWKITAARDRGLQPLLDTLFAPLIQMVQEIDENYTVEAVGLNQRTPEQEDQHDTQRVRTTCTVDEIRARDGQAPLPDGSGAIILDPTWMQARNMAQGMGGMGGMGGPTGGYADQPAPSANDPDAAQPTLGGQDDQGLQADAPQDSATAPPAASGQDAAPTTKSTSSHSWHLDL